MYILSVGSSELLKVLAKGKDRPKLVFLENKSGGSSEDSFERRGKSEGRDFAEGFYNSLTKDERSTRRSGIETMDLRTIAKGGQCSTLL